MDEERRAFLQQLANDCFSIAWDSLLDENGLSRSYGGEGRDHAVGRLAETLLEHELRREEARGNLREA